MDLLSRQLAELQRRYSDARFETASDGQRLLVVPGVPTNALWSMPTITIRVVIPAGYPHVTLDCFYTDATLRLASGAEPGNSSPQAVFGGQYRWFSWHVPSWDPNTATLDRYIRVCEARFREAR
jgi:Prokaryotic E2 family E